MISLSTNNYYVHDLYYVTRDISFNNVSSKDYNMIAHRLTTDIEFDDNLSDKNAIEKLRLFMISSRLNELTTSEVLNLFESLQLRDQIIIISKNEENN